MTRIFSPLRRLSPVWRRVFERSMVLSSSILFIELYALDITGLYPVNPTVLTLAAIFVILRAFRTVIGLFMRRETPLCNPQDLVCRLTDAAFTSLARHARNARNTWRLRGYPEYTIPVSRSWKIPKHAKRIVRDDLIIATWKDRPFHSVYWMGVVYGWDRHGNIHVYEYIGDGYRTYDDILTAIRYTGIWDVTREIKKSNATPMGQK